MGNSTSTTERQSNAAPDLAGKVVIVTGGNGIGYATVQQLARRGAKVYIAGRSEERVKAAIKRLQEEGLEPGNGELHWLQLDLEDPSTIKSFVAAFLERESRLDALVNNAGRLRQPYELGHGGIELAMLVNYAAPFMLTKALLPVLTETANEVGNHVRVVMVASSAIEQLPKGREIRYRNLDDWNQEYGDVRHLLGPKFGDQMRYAQSKLAIVLFAQELQRRVDAEDVPITVMSVDPGYVYTEGTFKDPARKIPVFGPILMLILKFTFSTPAEGARPLVYAATSPEVAERRDSFKGAYLVPPGKIGIPPHPQAQSVALAGELWDATESILKQWSDGTAQDH